MGQAKQRRERFNTEHPYCCLCGGSIPTECIEHAPPKVLFFNKKRPRGLEVPSCIRCNDGSSQQDQAVAAFAFSQSPIAISGRTALGAKYNARAIELMQRWATNNSDLGGTLIGMPDQWVQVNGVLQRVSSLILSEAIYDRFLNPWAVKQTLAFWYQIIGNPFSENGAIKVIWFTPQQRSDLRKFLANLPLNDKGTALKQGKFDTTAQFSFHHCITEDDGGAVFWVILHQGLSFVSFAFDDQPKLQMQKFLNNSALVAWSTNAKHGIHKI